MKKEDIIDYQAGIVIYKKIGEQVAEGDKVIEIFSNNKDKLKRAADVLMNSYKITKENVTAPKIIKKVIGVKI